MFKFDLIEILSNMDEADEWNLRDPEDILFYSLYLVKNDKTCVYKGKKIDLTATLFDILFELAEEPRKYKRVDKGVKQDDAFSDSERKNIGMINKAFRKVFPSSMDKLIVQKSKVGYRINLDLFSENRIIASYK